MATKEINKTYSRQLARIFNEICSRNLATENEIYLHRFVVVEINDVQLETNYLFSLKTKVNQ